jgi:hypothetical protein
MDGWNEGREAKGKKEDESNKQARMEGSRGRVRWDVR